MLLHKFYINVAIANILLCSKSLYDLPRQNCKIQRIEVGVVKKGVVLRNAQMMTMCTRVNFVI